MKIKTVCVVGGGSAGWMTAAWLARNCSFLKVKLVESDKTPIVGVGESTTMKIKSYTKGMDIKDEEFMPSCDATYKTSIQFTDFRRIGDPPFQYPFGWQCFEGMEHKDLKNNIWFLAKALGLKDLEPHTYADWYNPHVHMIKKNKFTDKTTLWKQAGLDGTTAYHFNTHKFGKWLKEKYCENVEHIIADVDGFITAEHGGIDHLKSSAGDIHADLYIDCMGFKAGLIQQFSKFMNFGSKLWVDKCIPVRLPYKDKNSQLTTVTDNCALGNGWVYTIPNWNSIGCGYVYCSKYASHKEALEEFKTHLKEKLNYDPEELEFAKEIQLKVGRHEVSWAKNVCSVGLSFGFIEPLESNGLETVINNILNLDHVLNMRKGLVTEKFIEIYNKKCNYFFDNFSDFINIHYALSERDDTPFWREFTSTNFHNMMFSDELGEAFNEQAFRSVNAVPNGTQYISAGMDVNPINKHIVAGGFKWQLDEEIADLEKIIEHKEKNIKDWTEEVEKISTTPYEWLRENIYKGVDDSAEIDEEYVKWMKRTKS